MKKVTAEVQDKLYKDTIIEKLFDSACCIQHISVRPNFRMNEKLRNRKR